MKQASPSFISCLAVVALGASGPAHAADVEGRVVRVGLFAGSTPIVRSGNRSFVEVDLRWGGDGVFEGELRVERQDRDGDIVTSVLDTPLAPDGQWHRHEVYFDPHDVANNDVVRVRLFDGEGRLVRIVDETGSEVPELVSEPMLDLPPDKFLIVDMTVPRKLAQVAWLDSDRAGESEWSNAREVRGMSPQELPLRWEGLEAVDGIVWDNADPSVLSQQQISSLVDWVRAGGRLLISAGTNWQALAGSVLSESLPVTIEGGRQVNEAQEFLAIVKDYEYERTLDKTYDKNGISRCQMRPLPTAIPIPADCDHSQIAFRRMLGRGSITFVGASLQELLPVPQRLAEVDRAEPIALSDVPDDDVFVRICKEVVGRNFLAMAPVREEKTGSFMGPGTENLFRKVRDSIGFRAAGAAFLVFAVLFAVAYTLVATVGSYWFLKRRCRQHQCWIAFAFVGIAGSVVGTVMVWSLRGVTTKVMQTTVVDGQAGLDYGHATCLFGVKTPNHTRLELSLPIGSADDPSGRRHGPLHPMPEALSMDVAESRFVAPDIYQHDVMHARLIDVPLRATLKEFLGIWHGPIGGTLDAKLIALKTGGSGGITYEFGEGSYIRNHLGVNLRQCYVLETPDEVALRASGVRCYFLGDLPKSGPSSTLADSSLRQALYYEKLESGGPRRHIGKWPRLDERIKDWTRRLPGVRQLRLGGDPLRSELLTTEQEVVALYLLSVFNLFEVEPQGGRILRRSHGRTLDCTHQLTRRTAILIGWSSDPPPAVLEIDRAASAPDKSCTIYRFVIPVERPGA